MNGLASIIIVLYNSSHYIEACIDSIMAQNYPHEIIAIDNNSTDDSCRILREKYPNVRLIESRENAATGQETMKGLNMQKANTSWCSIQIL
ncbi:MAG: glycosyltransferase [Methanothrix sp.]|nr:glycosyltransferase [Methanothrix sp.]